MPCESQRINSCIIGWSSQLDESIADHMYIHDTDKRSIQSSTKLIFCSLEIIFLTSLDKTDDTQIVSTKFLLTFPNNIVDNFSCIGKIVCRQLLRHCRTLLHFKFHSSQVNCFQGSLGGQHVTESFLLLSSKQSDLA